MTGPASLRVEDLARCVAPFEGAATLPAAAYTSAEVLDWELERFFAGSWLCAGRARDLGRPGDQRAVAIGPEAVLLARDGEGTLRGFHNTCRHRGHELLRREADATSRPVIQCPYHGWTYALDGSFRGAPWFKDHPTFDRHDPDHALRGVPVGEWGGWVFVNASGDAGPLEAHLGNLTEAARPYEPERLVVAASHEYVVEANWKVIVENYHECYHCSEIHPELCRVSPPESGEQFRPTGLVVGGSMDLVEDAETMSLDGRSLGVPFRLLEGRGRREVNYWGVFPNLLVSAHPDYVMTHRLEPRSPGETRVECQWLFAPESLEREGFDPSYAVEFWDLTNRQDWAACEGVQRGVAGRGYRQGPFSEMEGGVYQFVALVARGYLEGRARGPVAELPPSAMKVG